MYKETRKGTELVILAIGLGLREGTLSSVRERVAAVLGATPFLDDRSKKDIMGCALDLARQGSAFKKKLVVLCDFLAGHIDGVMKAWNRAYRRAWGRTAENLVRSGLKFHRFREDPVVFYLVSWHQKPQPAHEPLQGKVLVDREWRNVLVDVGDQELVKKVGSYVRDHNTLTVQKAMGDPYYLVVRPGCRHYLIPLKTKMVLDHDPKELRSMVRQRNRTVHRPLTDHDRWVAYVDLRNSVRTKLRKKLGLDREWKLG